MAQSPAVPRINPADETISVGPLTIRFFVTGLESNGTVTMFAMTVAGGAGLPAPPHSHDAYEETIYGLAGVLTWTVDGAPVEIGPGQSVCIPRGAVHMFANHGDVEAQALCVLTPAVLGPAYFREIAAVLLAAGGGPPDRAKMMEIQRRHGLIPAPPPPA